MPEFFRDLVWADVIGVIFEGKAFDQLIEAYRYYKQITTPLGATVQYTTAELDMLGRVEAAALHGPNRAFLANYLPSEINNRGRTTINAINGV